MFVNLFDGKTVVLCCSRKSTVESVTSLVEDRTSIPKNVQKLFFVSKQLERNKLLSHYGIGNFSTIHLTLQLLGGMEDGNDDSVVPNIENQGPPSAPTSSEPSPASDQSSEYVVNTFKDIARLFLGVAYPYLTDFTGTSEVQTALNAVFAALQKCVPEYQPNTSKTSDLHFVKTLLLSVIEPLLHSLENATVGEILGGEESARQIATDLETLKNLLRCVKLTKKKRKIKEDLLKTAMKNNFDKMSL